MLFSLLLINTISSFLIHPFPYFSFSFVLALSSSLLLLLSFMWFHLYFFPFLFLVSLIPALSALHLSSSSLCLYYFRVPHPASVIGRFHSYFIPVSLLIPFYSYFIPVLLFIPTLFLFHCSSFSFLLYSRLIPRPLSQLYPRPFHSYFIPVLLYIPFHSYFIPINFLITFIPT